MADRSSFVRLPLMHTHSLPSLLLTRFLLDLREINQPEGIPTTPSRFSTVNFRVDLGLPSGVDHPEEALDDGDGFISARIGDFPASDVSSNVYRYEAKDVSIFTF